MFKANVCNIMIGGPSDTATEAQIARKVINHWNDINAETRNVVLLPLHWTVNSHPDLDKAAQKVLNDQLVKRSDFMIAIFGSRIGTPTDDYISGTVEEIEEHRKANKPVMVFFRANNDLTRAEIDQLIHLKEYKDGLNGYFCDYQDENQFESILTDKLALLVNNLKSATIIQYTIKGRFMSR